MSKLEPLVQLYDKTMYQSPTGGGGASGSAVEICAQANIRYTHPAPSREKLGEEIVARHETC